MSEYRLAPGWVDYTTLTTTDAYRVALFPNAIRPNRWLVNTKGIVTTSAFPASLSVKTYQEGGLATEWDLAPVSPLQAGWFISTYGTSGAVTLMTYRINPQTTSGAGFGWVAIRCYMNVIGGIQPDATDNINNRWIPSYLIRFNRGTLIS